jgi:hypothetical protein
MLESVELALRYGATDVVKRRNGCIEATPFASHSGGEDRRLPGSRSPEVQKEEGQIIPWVFHRGGELIEVLKKSWKKATTAGDVIDILVTKHRDRRTAKRFFVRALKHQGQVPWQLVTDQL